MTDERFEAEDLLILTELPAPALITDAAGAIVYANTAFEAMSGYTSAELQGRDCRLLQGAETDPAAVRRMRVSLTAKQPFREEILNYRKDGVPFWNQLAVAPIRRDGEVVGFSSVQFDVSIRVAENAIRTSEASDAGALVQLAADLAQTEDLTAFSRRLIAELADKGVPAVISLTGDSLRQLVYDEQDARAVAIAERGEEHPDLTVVDLHTSSSLVARLTHPTPSGGGNEPRAKDQRERVRRIVQLASLAMQPLLSLTDLVATSSRDSLTGTLTRSSVHDLLRRRFTVPGDEVPLIFIDIDDFKSVNDEHGHATGDLVLTALADRLRRTLPADATLARIGGDEFLAVLNHPLAGPDLEKLIQQLQQVAAEPVPTPSTHIHTTCSIGVARGAATPGEAASAAAERVIAVADDAMYTMKRRRHAEGVHIGPDRQALYPALITALQQQHITVHLQPQHDSKTLQITGYEVFARWHDPVLGDIEPRAFIALAERIGLMDTLSELLIDRVRAAVDLLPTFKALQIAINIAPRQLLSHRTSAALSVLLLDLKARDITLALEISEPALETDTRQDAALARTLHQLHREGALVVLDDFGTALSALTMLQSLPIDTLKVDRTFVQRPGALGARMTTAIAALAHELGFHVAAEGIETTDQLEAARAAGCTTLQGHLLSSMIEVPRA